jgi:hypothetical protein
MVIVAQGPPSQRGYKWSLSPKGSGPNTGIVKIEGETLFPQEMHRRKPYVIDSQLVIPVENIRIRAGLRAKTMAPFLGCYRAVLELDSYLKDLKQEYCNI